MEKPWELSSLDLDIFFLPRSSMNSAAEESPLAPEGGLTEGDVYEIADNAHCAERDKYNPELFHHAPPYNACLNDLTVLVE